tara:strand:- start:416 stop:1339 length:924 start_codon:yes stop_codon:yes gene_type:complete
MLNKYKNFNSIAGGASKKKIYRVNKKNNNFIILDFCDDKEEFNKHLIVYDILNKIDISIPKIFEIDYEKKLILTEDFGTERFDKVISKYELNNLLECATDSLIVINNSTIGNDYINKLSSYDYNIFEDEISEFTEFFFTYNNIDKSLCVEFFEIWKNYYHSLNFEFKFFVHKDFELTNLMYLPENKYHLKCGILDFQSSFIGFKGWDLFSLLENPRIYFQRENNEKIIKYYYSKTYPNIEFDLFRKQYYFLNTSRHTRLLGRWVKFLKINNNDFYLKFIDTTIRRLRESLIDLNIKELNYIYDKILI